MKDSNFSCKISRKRSQCWSEPDAHLGLPKRKKIAESEFCNIELIPSNEEAEEHIIVIKKECDESFFDDQPADVKHELSFNNYSSNPSYGVETSCSAYKGKTKEFSLETQKVKSIRPDNGEERSTCCFKNENYNFKENCQSFDYAIKFNAATNHAGFSSNVPNQNMEPEMMSWVEKLKIPGRCQVPQHFLVDKFSEVKSILTTYEHETFTRLLVNDVNGGFTQKKEKYSGETVHFREKGKQNLLFNGTPFSICGRLTFRCHQGLLHKRTDKEIKRNKLYGSDRKRYRKLTMSKKKNCPFKINVLKVFIFPDYIVDDRKDDPYKLYKISSYIKKNKEKINFLVKYVFTLPSVFEHQNHQLGDESVAREPVDKRVFEKIEQCVKNGITKPVVIKDLLKSFIQHDLGVESSQWERRKYNPSIKDIRAKIYRTLSNMKTNKFNLRKEVTQAKSNTINDETIMVPVVQNETLIREINVQQPKLEPGTLLCKEDDGRDRIFDYHHYFHDNITVDLSEGNVHREEMIPLDSFIDEDNDGDKQKLLGDNLSKLNFLSIFLKHENLTEFSNDIGNIVAKWQSALNVYETTESKLPSK